MRASVPKNDHLVFSKFLRKYKDALHKFSLTQVVTLEPLKNVLGYMGYTDQYASDHSEQLVHSIAYMLSQDKDCCVDRADLFEFLRIISDIKKFHVPEFAREVKALSNDVNKHMNEPLIPLRLGAFSSTGEWTCTPEE